MKKIKLHSLYQTKEFGLKLATFIQPGMLITLSGELGAGKTTFSKALGAALGVKKTMNSPTFTILKVYQGIVPIYHIDAYRLEGIEQDLGFEEYFEDDGLCIVEWPQYIEEQLPKERLEISITRMEGEHEESRMFTIRAYGKKYEKIVEEL